MGAVARKEIRELFCQCGGNLVLHIKMEEEMTAQLVYKIESDDPDAPPCFSVDFDGPSEVEYTPYFKCSKCQVRAYSANIELEFNEEEELLIFPNFNEDDRLGYVWAETRSCEYEHQYPFAPDKAIPKKEEEPEKLPTIKRASAGESIEPAAQGPVAAGTPMPYPAEDWYGLQ